MIVLMDVLRISLANLFVNRLRAVLTMLGITIGVAAVIVLLSIGKAFENFIIGEFNSVGSNLVAVFGAQGDRGDFEPLTQKDFDALSDPTRVWDTLFVVPFLEVNANSVTYENYETSPSIFGITADYIQVEEREIIAGRYIEAEDVEGNSRVAVLGLSAVEKLFVSGVPPLDQTIRIDGVAFKVVGVLDKGGSGGFVDLDNSIFVPMSTAQTRLVNNREVSGELPVTQIILKAPDESRIDGLVEQITATLREVRDIQFNGEDDFTISTQADLLDSIGTILNLLTQFLATIAGVSLLVGGIGIMNIMLVTVTERTKEIGLRKALGAQNIFILIQFVAEALVLSLLGGTIGILIAFAGGALVSSLVESLNVTVQPFSIILAVVISSAIGIFFGFFPAWRAAGLNPIDALRYE